MAVNLQLVLYLSLYLIIVDDFKMDLRFTFHTYFFIILSNMVSLQIICYCNFNTNS